MRNQYFDLLRAVAITRVITYHTFGRAWMTIVLPAMGLMFAIAGSLMASSLEAHGSRRAVISRVRRLLPPIWAFGLVAVPVMLIAGWSSTDPRYPLDWPRLFFWLIPLGDPPGSSWGRPAWDVLWYLRAYLWFVIASPLIYLAYRRLPWATVFAPLVLLVALTVFGFTLPDTVVHNPIWDVAIFGACWAAGFAHHDGRLARLSLPILLLVAGVAATAGLGWLFTHKNLHTGDLNDLPMAQGFWSLAFVLLALRWQPGMSWMDRAGPLGATVRLLNSRAVTVYLWHNPLIAVASALLTALALGHLGRWAAPATLAVAVVLIGVAIAVTGWVEDLAAHRRPTLWPVPIRPRPDPIGSAPPS